MIGFEKYGYTLQIDTINEIQESLISSKLIGYFDLVNNTDSTIKLCQIGWSIDNMGLETEGNHDSLFKPRDSIKIKYTIFKGLSRIANSDFNLPIIPTINNDMVPNKKMYIEKFREHIKRDNKQYSDFMKSLIKVNDVNNYIVGFNNTLVSIPLSIEFKDFTAFNFF